MRVPVPHRDRYRGRSNDSLWRLGGNHPECAAHNAAQLSASIHDSADAPRRRVHARPASHRQRGNDIDSIHGALDDL